MVCCLRSVSLCRMQLPEDCFRPSAYLDDDRVECGNGAQRVVVACTEGGYAVEPDAETHHLVLVVGEAEDAVGIEDMAHYGVVEPTEHV